MMHKASCSIGEVPYNFSRSSTQFQGHTGWKINDLDHIWTRLLGQWQLSNPSDVPCYLTKSSHILYICDMVNSIDPSSGKMFTLATKFIDLMEASGKNQYIIESERT